MRGVERSTGSYTPNSDDSSQEVDIGDGGDSERSYSNSGVQAVSVSEEEALLGQPFLGARVLCRYRGSQRGDDPEVREVSREKRASSGAT